MLPRESADSEGCSNGTTLEQVRYPSQRTRGDRDEVGREVRRDVRYRGLVHLRDVACGFETVPVFHTRRLSLILAPCAGGISPEYAQSIQMVLDIYCDSDQNDVRDKKEQHRGAPSINGRSHRWESRSRDTSIPRLRVDGRRRRR